MQKSVSASLLDWVVEAARWLALLAAALMLAIRGPIGTPALAILSILALWSGFFTWFAAQNRRLPAQAWIKTVGDLLLAILLFFTSNHANGPLNWIGIMPVLSAALHFNLWGALIMALSALVLQALSVWLLSAPDPLAFASYLIIPTLLYLVSGAGISLLIRYFFKPLLPVRRSAGRNRGDNSGSATGKTPNIYNLVSVLSSELNAQHVLQTALQMAGSSLGDSKLVSAALLFSEDEPTKSTINLVAGRGLGIDAEVRQLPIAESVLAPLLHEGNAHYSGELSKDPLIGQFEKLKSCHSIGILPLRSGIKFMGFLLFAHPQNRYFSTERCELLEIIADQTAIALNNALLYGNLEAEKQRLVDLQEESRKRLARDLHDGPTQSIAAIAMRVNFAKRLVSRDLKASAEELYKIEELARRTTKEIRNMLFTMRPVMLETDGLPATLQAMADKMRETYNQNVIIQADSQVVSRLDTNKSAVVYYIAEEAVNNARKHAQAEHIWVRLRPLKGDLCLLEIQDDGAGFNVGSVNASYENRGSLGMVNMRERTEALEGALHLSSAEGQGTHIQVAIPLTAESAARLRKAK